MASLLFEKLGGGRRPQGSPKPGHWILPSSAISKTETEKSCWLLGPKAVQAGSLHCDLWRGRTIDLALHDGIAVYPVGGRWKSLPAYAESPTRHDTHSSSRSGPDQAIELHAEAASLVNAGEIETPIG